MNEQDGKNVSIDDIEAIFGEDSNEKEIQKKDEKPAFDPNKIKMNCSADFKNFSSPPKLVLKGKIPDGSVNGQPFYVTREVGTTGKVRIEIYAKIGYGFIVKDKKYVFQGELNYEHKGIENMKKHSFFGYDNQDYISFSLAEPIEKTNNGEE